MRICGKRKCMAQIPHIGDRPSTARFRRALEIWRAVLHVTCSPDRDDGTSRALLSRRRHTVPL